MLTAGFFTWLLTVAFFLALYEIVHEGSRGWAEGNPLWEPEPGSWVDRLYRQFNGDKQLTGYHLIMLTVTLGIIHLPFLPHRIAAYIVWTLVVILIYDESRDKMLSLRTSKSVRFFTGKILPFIELAFYGLGIVFVVPLITDFLPEVGTVSLGKELQVLSTFLLVLTVEDLWWFMLNPHYGPSRFREDAIWWHNYWIGRIPTDYPRWMFGSVCLAALSVVLNSPAVMLNWLLFVAGFAFWSVIMILFRVLLLNKFEYFA